MPFDAAAMSAKVDAVAAAYAAREQARADCRAAMQVKDEAEVAFENAKAAAITELGRQAGAEPFTL